MLEKACAPREEGWSCFWDGMERARAPAGSEKKSNRVFVSLSFLPRTHHTQALSHSLSLPLVAPNP